MSVKMAFLVKCQENVSKNKRYGTIGIFVLQAHADTRFPRFFACESSSGIIGLNVEISGPLIRFFGTVCQ